MLFVRREKMYRLLLLLLPALSKAAGFTSSLWDLLHQFISFLVSGSAVHGFLMICVGKYVSLGLNRLGVSAAQLLAVTASSPHFRDGFPVSVSLLVLP